MKNIILLTIDTLRKDMAGIYNEKLSLTPYLESLEESCTVYRYPYSTGPYTQASFQGIVASDYYLEYGKEKKLNSKKILISEILKGKGIYTAAFHSNAYLSYYFGYNRGWDTFYDSMSDDVSDMYPFIRGEGINNKVKGFLSNFSFKKPLFLWVHYMDVHEPYIAEDSYLSQIDPNLKLSKEEMFSLFKNTLHPRDISSTNKIDTLKKLYMAKVKETDGYLKNLFSIFSKHSLLDNSAVIITSDHGDEFSEHGGLSHDGKMYNELVSVPLLIYEKSKKSKVVDTPVSLIDIPPTICDMLNTDLSPSFKGTSLLSSSQNRSIFGEAMGKIGHKEKDTDEPVYFLLEGNLKVIYNQKDSSWQAYDQKKDKKEENNIISKVSDKSKDKLSNFINRKRKE